MASIVKTSGAEKVTIDGEKVKSKKDLITKCADYEVAYIPVRLSSSYFGIHNPCVLNGKLYCTFVMGNGGELFYLDDDTWKSTGVTGCDIVCGVIGDALYYMTSAGYYLHKYDGVNTPRVAITPNDMAGHFNVSIDCICIFDNKIYYYQGHSHSFWEFNGNSWTDVTLGMFGGLYDPQTMFVYNNELYVMDKSRDNSLTSVLMKYEGNSWISKGNMPISNNNNTHWLQTGQYFFIEYNGELHAFYSLSYYNGSNLTYSQYHYKYDGDVWAELSPIKCANGVFGVLNNELYQIAGNVIINNNIMPMNTTRILDKKIYSEV